MSKLIQMRRRIKAIETLKKVTHAMRLISMSSHSRLKSKQQFLSHYVSTIQRLFATALESDRTWRNPIMQPDHTPAPANSTDSVPKQLIIVIGSQKGLCGNFNSMLINKLAQISDLNNSEKTAVIVVGKKAHETIKNIAPLSIIKTYDNFTASTFLSIAPALINTITTAATPYQKVVAISTISKSFFLQVAHETTLIPLPQAPAQTERTPHQALPAKDYIWDHSQQETLTALAYYYLEAHIEQLLFESLLAEQAARFISMDGSTRNAQTLLNETQLQYNKTRQAKITRDLTELVSSF
jgi:F-type H+-transporting ATPase subunit gamma